MTSSFHCNWDRLPTQFYTVSKCLNVYRSRNVLIVNLIYGRRTTFLLVACTRKWRGGVGRPVTFVDGEGREEGSARSGVGEGREEVGRGGGREGEGRGSTA